MHKMIQQKHFVDFAMRVNKQKWLLLYGLGVTGMTFNTLPITCKLFVTYMSVEVIQSKRLHSEHSHCNRIQAKG